jgi:hypothetical protein
MTDLFAANDANSLVVVYSNGKWVTIDTDTNDVIGTYGSFSLDVEKGWSTSSNTLSAKRLRVYLELAESATTSLAVTESSEENFSYDRTFRVPKAVKAEGRFTEDTATLREIYDYTRDPNYNVVPEPPITFSWLRNIRDKHPLSQRALTAAGFIPDPKSLYFGVPVDEDTPFIMNGLLRLDTTTNQWSVRTVEHWDELGEDEVPGFLVELDPDSAAQIALWIDKPDLKESDTIEFSNIYPEEAGLFFAAESELDLEFLDTVFDIYDSQERSINAKKQVRGQGGKFGPGGKTNAPAESTPKARLPQSLPIIPDIGKRIDEYLADVARQRVKNQEAPDKEFAVSAEASGVEVTDVAPLYVAIVDDIDPDAVLDVVALVPPKRGTQGDVSAWKRDNGQWIAAPEILQQMRGSTPPSTVELKDVNILKQVLEQVDKSTAVDSSNPAEAPGQTEVDSGGNPAETPAMPAQGTVVSSGVVNIDRERAIKEGWSLPDGSFPIRNKEDLKRAVKAYGRAKNKTKAKNHIKRRARALKATDLLPDAWSVWDIARGFSYSDGSLTIHDTRDLLEAIELAQNEDQEAHIVKRARALNRIDLIPHGWDIYTMPEPDLWGPFGELVAAGGLDRNRGNAERLRRYWTKGPGGAKIGWGTGGDWYRCVSHLSKYLGTRAKGYCALRHKEMNGYYPGDKKNH